MYSLVILSALSLAALALGRYSPCEPCKGEECFVQPEGCVYGTGQDMCGRLKCMAGPGQRCGGRDNHLGKCGGGMTCKCGKCRGCSIERLKAGVLECDNSANPVCY